MTAKRERYQCLADRLRPGSEVIRWWRLEGGVSAHVTAVELAGLLPSLSGGMVPKMEACLRAVRGGVPAAHIVDGRVAHSILLEVFTSEGFGTMVTA